MAVLAILQPDARAAARLSGPLAGAHQVRVHASWEALERSLADETVDACLIDADHPNREHATRRIMALRDRFPGMAIVACVESDRETGYYSLGGLGVEGVVVAGSGAQKLRGDVDAALSTARGEAIERALQGTMATPGPEAVAWAVEHAGPDTSVERLAVALGHSPRGLGDALRLVGLPSPGRILLWGRLLLAGARLGNDHRTVEDVAFSLGYSTSISLSRAMKRHTGLTPAEISRQGGMAAVCDALFRGPLSALPDRPTPSVSKGRAGTPASRTA